MPNYPSYEVKSNQFYKENNTADFYIELTEGPFTGLCFVFGPIMFDGEDEQGNGKVKFDYHLLFIPAHVNFDEQKPDIEGVVGAILQHLLETMVTNDETGTSDTESTAEGRGLSQEGDSISEG